LDFALWLLCALTVKALYYFCVVRFRSSELFSFVFVVTMGIAGLEETGDFGGGKGFDVGGGREIFGV
jgi:hypothetical protein